MPVRIDLDINDRFAVMIEGYEHLLSESVYYAAARIREELILIYLGTLENAIANSGMPAIYALHLRNGIDNLLTSGIEVVTGYGRISASVPDIRVIGDAEDLKRGFHYHALLAGDQPADGSKWNKNPSALNRVELPYTGQDLKNDSDTRGEFWEHIVDGTVYTVRYTTVSKGRGWNRIVDRSFEVPTAGLYEETLQARVSTWGNRYPEWMLLEYGDEGTNIAPTHFISMIETKILDFMEDTWVNYFQSLIDQWEDSRGSGVVWQSAVEEREWERIYDKYQEIDIRDYSFESRGRGSKIRGPGGRFA